MSVGPGKRLTRIIKGNLLAWFRFVKRYKYVATEVGYKWKSDVLAIGADGIIEVEVKVSIQDLEKEVEKSKKHACYKKGIISIKMSKEGQIIPNKYYICVPEKIKGRALEVAKFLNPMYGVIVFLDKKDITNTKELEDAALNLKVIRPAKRLRDAASNEEGAIIKNQIVARITSELASLKCSKEVIERV